MVAGAAGEPLAAPAAGTSAYFKHLGGRGGEISEENPPLGVPNHPPPFQFTNLKKKDKK